MIHQQPTLEQALADFLKALAGKNRSVATSRAYQTDIHQFITWLHENNIVVVSPIQVERSDITEYLAALAERKLSGVSRARKVAALREYFRYLVDHEIMIKSPAIGIETPKREKNGRTALAHDEYTDSRSCTRCQGQAAGCAGAGQRAARIHLYPEADACRLDERRNDYSGE